MKRFLPILIALICFSCATAQKVEQVPVNRVNAYVHNTYGEVTILQSKDSKISFEVSKDSTLIKGKEYVFWLEITDLHDAQTKKATVIKKSFTVGQVQRDQATISQELANRKIIRQ